MYKEDYKRYDVDEKKGSHKRYDSKKRKDGRDKEKRSLCSMETHSSKDEYGDESNEESFFLAIEKKNKEIFGRLEGVKNNRNLLSEKTTLHAKVEQKAWIIDSGCSNHMTNNKEKFINLEKYDGESMKFTREEVAPFCVIRSITIDGNHKIIDVNYVEGLRHYLFNVTQMCNKGYEVAFSKFGCVIRK